jgi:hypothetical protein
LVTLSLMRPKIVEVMTAVGLSNAGLLRTFLASTLKSKLTRSAIVCDDAGHARRCALRACGAGEGGQEKNAQEE